LAALVLAAGLAETHLFQSDRDLNLGVFHGRQGQWSRALERLDGVSRWHAEAASARYMAGNVLRARKAPGDLEEALTRYNQALALVPQHAPAHYRIGLTYADMRRWKDSAGSLQASVAADQDYAPAYLKLAEVWTYLGKKEEARRAAAQLVRIEPLHEAHWKVLAEKYRDLGRNATALRMLDRAERVHAVAGGGNGRRVY